MRVLTVVASLCGSAVSTHAATPPGRSCLALRSLMVLASSLARCCTGRLRCAQLLSTASPVHPAHDLRT